MAKRTFKLAETERKELLKAYQVSKEAATRTRYQAVRLYGEGYAEKDGLSWNCRDLGIYGGGGK